ncbi:response regulator transcription factor [Hathewaya limosa]|uniref:Stage 0 sporulation protein A homolog n=1 Tax=Hathewaya limosa TaxID=1536 RepID=A0ABU0JQB0_HATLI|nr:response regulator transcription factor [Hathewaya limosa]MDQ0479286.1 DNA-binding response OmpR family regulator [Hathewaya limosa]
MENKVLIVEDEANIRSFVKIFLKNNGFNVFECERGEDALKIVTLEKPNIVILDVMLPGIDGFKVCEELRKQNKNIGIIMLTARGQDNDKIEGFETGADDYMVKPFNPKELLLRIKSLLRRVSEENKEQEDACIISEPFKLDIYAQKLFKNDTEIDMTPREFLLMKTFMENPGKAFSREELLSTVWGWDFYGESKIVDVNMRRLRTKIEDNPSEPKFIETVWGKGYRWVSNI